MHHLGKGLDNYIGNYDNILLLGDFNSEFSEPCLNDFCDIYNLKNLVKEPTCYKNSDNPSCIDLFLTNRPWIFQCTTTIETGISDFHKLVVTVLKTFYKKQRPKIIHYRNYKNFENGNFGQVLLKFDITNAPLSKFNDTVLSVLDKHAPKKVKYIRSNNCNFMTKELRKAIMNRSKLRNKFLKTRNEKSRRRFNRQRNLCASLIRKTKRSFYGKLNHKVVSDNRKFWKSVGPLFSEKAFHKESI